MVNGQRLNRAKTSGRFRLFADGAYAILFEEDVGIFLTAYAKLPFSFPMAQGLPVFFPVRLLISANNFRLFCFPLFIMFAGSFFRLFRVVLPPFSGSQPIFFALIFH